MKTKKEKEQTRKETGAFKYDFVYDDIISKLKKEDGEDKR